MPASPKSIHVHDQATSSQEGAFEPDYVAWRAAQLAQYDRDYAVWREAQARRHDEQYLAWRRDHPTQFDPAGAGASAFWSRDPQKGNDDG